MEYLFLLGRILYGGFFVLAGVNHFRHTAMMAGYAASKGIPVPRVAVLGSGLLLLLGGLSIALGFHPAWGVAFLTVFLVPTTLSMHNFWADTDPSAQMNNLIHFQKNTALLGAAWMLLMLPQPWVFSLG
jgi:putative oxidoreductase